MNKLQLLTTLVSPLTVCAVCAATYDLKTDFSTSNNPNGTWSYKLDDAVASLGVRGADPFFPPGPPAIWGIDGTYPGWSQSIGTDNSQLGPLDLQTGDIYAHSWMGGHKVQIDWTSPAPGVINVSAAAWALRDVGRANEFHLLLNGVAQISATTYSGDPYDRANPNAFGFSAAVSAGDVVQFLAVPTTVNGNGTDDYFGLNLRVDLEPRTGVPDSGNTSVLLCFGVSALALARKRFEAHRSGY
jgi:hypothetical protein